MAAATVGGVAYSDVRFFMDGAFTAPSVTLPDVPLGRFQSVTLTSPFTFTGRLRLTTADGMALSDTAATGSGVASALLISSGDPAIGFFDEDEQISYAFTDEAVPTPEPTSRLLLGTGLVGLLCRRR